MLHKLIIILERTFLHKTCDLGNVLRNVCLSFLDFVDYYFAFSVIFDLYR